ncbi:Na+/H+ antiporter NhaA [Candidatus Symbiopectobacterium sp. NZEC135]|uniref:Na+/H+ antiporter NhaA n=1 Tax=Candidatus Symbiopectobacterium sp. NZEC135 TaxID=2820471 RepID=UPI002226BF70|nr:Na+/H+ antiporter NhaA [Candidatus Symbiopectobacterium sp. NZEC135]MCW2477962.1 Na+/H+ antiporter NhaA [Candidatus Symbiopectobacterium sp. NZEC135]
MNRHLSPQGIPRAQRLAERAFATLERFLHIEAVSGIVLLVAAAVALIWANSPWAESYHALWHLPLSFSIGDTEIEYSLHFWINDAFMTLFFLVVGMEIRREIHEGALSSLRQAILPIAAAVGGVIVPALIYLSVNSAPLQQQGWAVPTATDIAFAVGVLALLGKGIPGNVRVFLLALAIIDDIIAVLIIAFFYSGGLEYNGLIPVLVGVLLVFGLQKIGIGSAWAYVIPGIIVWLGFLLTGAHPTLAGVVLGLITPVASVRVMKERPLERLSHIVRDLMHKQDTHAAEQLAAPLKQLRHAQREVLPPVTRVQMALHPWVAYGVMPLFALANAGVSVNGIDLSGAGPLGVIMGVTLALVAGKLLGVVSVSWLMVRFGGCQLPPDVSWRGVFLIGLLAGIGFTMSIFIAMLAFDDAQLLGAAKLGVLLGSVIAATLGLLWGRYYARSRRAQQADQPV